MASREFAILDCGMFEGLLRTYASHALCWSFSVDLYPAGRAAAAGVYAGQPQSESVVLGRDQWGDVFCACGRRAGARRWDEPHSGGDLFVCGESYEFGGCSGGCGRDSSADCDLAEGIAV